MPDEPITYREKKTIYERDGGRCYLCNEDVPFEQFALSHIIPIWEFDDIRNKALVCSLCNAAKGDMDPLEYRLGLSLNGERWRLARIDANLREVPDEA